MAFSEWSQPDSTFTLSARSGGSSTIVEIVATGLLSHSGWSLPASATTTASRSGGSSTVIEIVATGTQAGSGITLVEVRVDGGSWISAVDTSGNNSWSTWEHEINVSSLAFTHSHTIEARATDAASRVSPILSRTFYYSESDMWAATSVQAGHLTPLKVSTYT